MAFSFDLGLAISAERYGAISAGPEQNSQRGGFLLNRSKKKTVVLALTAITLMSALTFPASAMGAVPQPLDQSAQNATIDSRWTSTTLVVPSIKNSGKNISVSLLIKPKQSKEKTKGTLYLEQYDGSGWKEVKSWPISESGTVNVTKTYTVKDKARYRARVAVTTGADDISATSTEVDLS